MSRCMFCGDTGRVIVSRGPGEVTFAECGAGCLPPSHLERVRGFVRCRTCHSGKRIESRTVNGQQQVSVWQCEDCAGTSRVSL